MNINVLFVASALNRQFKPETDNFYDDLPDLLDDNGNISEDISNLEENFTEYFTLIKNIINYDQVKFLTIDPAYINQKKNINLDDDINYLGHIPTLLEDISLNKYSDFFDCIFVTSAYDDIFNKKNIDILNKLLKKNSFLITTYPSGINQLNSTFTHIVNKTDNNKSFNIFKKHIQKTYSKNIY